MNILASSVGGGGILSGGMRLNKPVTDDMRKSRPRRTPAMVGRYFMGAREISARMADRRSKPFHMGDRDPGREARASSRWGEQDAGKHRAVGSKVLAYP